MELTTGRFFNNNEGGLRGVRQPMGIDYVPITLKWLVWGCGGGRGSRTVDLYEAQAPLTDKCYTFRINNKTCLFQGHTSKQVISVGFN